MAFIHHTRRVFLLQLAATGGTALAATTLPGAGGPQPVDEKSASASALGYVSDHTRADRKRFPSAGSHQRCGTCSYFQSGANTCPVFAGRLVNSSAWCSSWTKKPS